MSIYSNADTERVYRISREYVEETQRYIRMLYEADPNNSEVREMIATLDTVIEKLVAQKEWWQGDGTHNPDWDIA